MDARRGIVEGMTVYTQDGEKLGKVVAVDDAGLFVRRATSSPGSTASGSTTSPTSGTKVWSSAWTRRQSPARWSRMARASSGGGRAW